MHAGPQRFDDARGFVAVYCGQLTAPMPVGKHDVTMTNRTGSELHFYLAFARISNSDVFNYQGVAKCSTNRCFQRFFLGNRMRLNAHHWRYSSGSPEYITGITFAGKRSLATPCLEGIWLR